jgi:hypothetical protein
VRRRDGDDRWSHPSACAGAGERRWAGGDAMGRLGQATALGCDGGKNKAGYGAGGPGRREGGASVEFCWLGSKPNWAERKGGLG